MAKKSAPDPRFDPRFQRGYDGPEPAAPPTPAVPSPLETARPTARGTAEIAAAPDAGVPEPGDGADDDEFWSPPRRNPFAIALLVSGIALIAVGIWLIWSVVTQSSYPDGNDRAALAFSLVQNQVTPALLIAGLLGIIGWLVLGALSASGRRGD